MKKLLISVLTGFMLASFFSGNAEAGSKLDFNTLPTESSADTKDVLGSVRDFVQTITYETGSTKTFVRYNKTQQYVRNGSSSAWVQSDVLVYDTRGVTRDTAAGAFTVRISGSTTDTGIWNRFVAGLGGSRCEASQNCWMTIAGVETNVLFSHGGATVGDLLILTSDPNTVCSIANANGGTDTQLQGVPALRALETKGNAARGHVQIFGRR